MQYLQQTGGISVDLSLSLVAGLSGEAAGVAADSSAGVLLGVPDAFAAEVTDNRDLLQGLPAGKDG
jgi:hypothetical protein